MARIVLGVGTSHTPQLSTSIDWWHDHAARDRRNPFLVGRDGEAHDYDGLLAVPEWRVPPERLTPEVWTALHDRSQECLQELASAIAATAPDVVVVVGDDQDEMFLDDGQPTFAVFWGEEILDIPLTDAMRESMPAGLLAASWAAHGEIVEKYPVPGALGRHIIGRLVSDEFDVAALSRQPEGRSVGHAFTFVRRRLMGETMIPLLPVALNAYNPPNQPTPRRCFQFGRSLRRAIESYPEDITVAVVASGGLSHFVVDEELDRRVLTALRERDVDTLTTVPRRFMRSGTSETLNWIAAGGALEHLSMEVVDYLPAYRSEAGTGVGMCFALWR
jgi:3-O-methylgallate 3,4-dioxygenase